MYIVQERGPRLVFPLYEPQLITAFIVDVTIDKEKVTANHCFLKVMIA
jgi:hypothetical protein